MSEQIDLTLLDPILEKYRGQGDALIAMLQEMQEVYSYLPREALNQLSSHAKVPMSRIYAVATFYSQFYLTPRGKNTIRVCRGTACHVQGCEPIIAALTDTLGIDVGGTTDDLQFSLETVACLGTCFLAPVMMVNDSYYGKLDQQKAKAIPASYAGSSEES